jgi:ADP-ribose pyrophosphatase
MTASDRGGSTLLTRKSVWPGKTVRLDLERVALPGGAVAELEIVHHPGASCVVPVLATGEIVLVRQFRHAAGGWLLEAPAGKLDPGEAPEVCARRELEEETGLIAGSLQKLGAIHTTPGFSDEIIHLFVARDLTEGRMAHEANEVMTIERHAAADVLAMLRDGRITDAKTICALALLHL